LTPSMATPSTSSRPTRRLATIVQHSGGKSTRTILAPLLAVRIKVPHRAGFWEPIRGAEAASTGGMSGLIPSSRKIWSSTISAVVAQKVGGRASVAGLPLGTRISPGRTGMPAGIRLEEVTIRPYGLYQQASTHNL